MAHHPLATARTLLFVPGDRPERFAKALAAGAGAVIIDLEDAVAPAAKAAARGAIEAAWAGFSEAERTRTVVRTNAAATPYWRDDLALLTRLKGLGAAMPAKAEEAGALRDIAAAAGRGCALLPLVESVAGIDALDAIAAAPQVLRLAFGTLDFQADLGLACDADEAELLPARIAIAMASRRAGLEPPVDGPTAAIGDTDRLRADTLRARRAGFTARLCIHPAQVAGVEAALHPSADEIVWAHRVVDALEAAGGGVVRVDGRMVDAPVERRARRLLAQAG